MRTVLAVTRCLTFAHFFHEVDLLLAELLLRKVIVLKKRIHCGRQVRCELAMCLGELLQGFENVLIPEMNTGQLRTLLRAELLVPAKGLNKVTGKPFKISEIDAAARDLL